MGAFGSQIGAGTRLLAFLRKQDGLFSMWDDPYWIWHYKPFHTRFVFSDYPDWSLSTDWAEKYNAYVRAAQEAEKEESAMSKVLAKFHLTDCSTQRYETNEGRDPETGRYISGVEVATHIKMSAVQGEPFGKYTPMGTIDMIIKNEGAAKPFVDAWAEWMANKDPKAKAPEFYVMLQRDHGLGWEA